MPVILCSRIGREERSRKPFWCLFSFPFPRRRHKRYPSLRSTVRRSPCRFRFHRVYNWRLSCRAPDVRMLGPRVAIFPRVELPRGFADVGHDPLVSAWWILQCPPTVRPLAQSQTRPPQGHIFECLAALVLSWPPPCSWAAERRAGWGCQHAPRMERNIPPRDVHAYMPQIVADSVFARLMLKINPNHSVPSIDVWLAPRPRIIAQAENDPSADRQRTNG